MLPVRPSFSDAELRQILENEFSLHPEAVYVDIYKLLNQVFYGPTHINPIQSQIESNIRIEIASITAIKDLSFQDIGCGKGFVRFDLASLSALRDSAITLLAESILRSRLGTEPTPKEWFDLFTALKPIIMEHLRPTAQEASEVEALLRSNGLPSHSILYKHSYSPHYRVIYHTELQNIFALAQNPREDH
jgi:hypothetical protein